MHGYWVKDIEEVAQIAEFEPRIAYSAFTKGICHRWTFFMRTIPDISDLLRPLETALSTVFIPALTGKAITQLERDILELPVRYGGLGIINPVRVAQREYLCSRKMTQPLVNLICQQNCSLDDLDREEIMKVKSVIEKEKANLLNQRRLELHEQAGHRLQNNLDQAMEKGASSWLTALPLRCLNYTLNKREFQDSICLRYGWDIKDLPSYCGCGKKNNLYHTLDCKSGGYVSMRHNAIRDTFAYLLREAKCKDVRVEPTLLPVNPANFALNTNVQEEARLDISAVGFYSI